MDLITMFKIVCLGWHPELQHLFVRSKDSRTRGHDFKLEVIRSKASPRLFRFSLRTVNLWNDLPAENVNVNTVADFKVKIDKLLWFSSTEWSTVPVPGASYPRA